MLVEETGAPSGRVSADVTIFSYLPFAAAILGLCLAVISLLPRKRSVSAWCFFAGMTVLSADSLTTGIIMRAPELNQELSGVVTGLVVKSLIPAAWLFFSATYSRGNQRESLRHWRTRLAVFGLLPFACALFFRDGLMVLAPANLGGEGVQLRLSGAAKAVYAILLVGN